MNLDHATDLATVEADLVSWMAVHGQLLLALRHPQNIGASAQLVSDFCDKIGKMLVEGGLLTQRELDYTYEVERQEKGKRPA